VVIPLQAVLSLVEVVGEDSRSKQNRDSITPLMFGHNSNSHRGISMRSNIFTGGMMRYDETLFLVSVLICQLI
jgi:hypothetical protein